MSWFKNPWLTSNPWAQGKPEFQKAIGQSPKTDDTPIEADNASNKFTPGYLLVGTTIVFSTFVYDNTTEGNEERKKSKLKTSKRVTDIYMNQAKNLQSTFAQGGFTFDFKWQVVDTPKYKYVFGQEDKELPDYYFMYLNDGVGDEGGTHVNTDNPTKSSYFQVGLLKNDSTKNSRTIIHESLHPLLHHSWVESANNPLFATFKSLLDYVRKLIEDNTPTGKIIALVRENKAVERAIIRNNIMTTAALDSAYNDIISYLDDFYVSSKLNTGRKLDKKQFEKIKNDVS